MIPLNEPHEGCLNEGGGKRCRFMARLNLENFRGGATITLASGQVTHVDAKTRRV